MILLNAAKRDDGRLRASYDSHFVVLHLMMVCSPWRTLCLGTRQLWSSLFLSARSRHYPTVLQTVIHCRSTLQAENGGKQEPLSLDLTHIRYGDLNVGLGYWLRRLERPGQDISPNGDQAPLYATSWRFVTGLKTLLLEAREIYAGNQKWLMGFLQSHSKSIQVECFDNDIGSMEPSQDSGFAKVRACFLSSPSMRQVRISNRFRHVAFGLEAGVLVEGFANITHLSLIGRLVADECIAILSFCHRVVDVEFDSMYAPKQLSEYPVRLVRPHLQALKVAVECNVEWFLNHFACPSLKCLFLMNGRKGCGPVNNLPEHYSSLGDFIELCTGLNQLVIASNTSWHQASSYIDIMDQPAFQRIPEVELRVFNRASCMRKEESLHSIPLIVAPNVFGSEGRLANCYSNHSVFISHLGRTARSEGHIGRPMDPTWETPFWRTEAELRLPPWMTDHEFEEV